MARLSLAKIAIKTPKLLLFKTISNNIDLETKEHVIQVHYDNSFSRQYILEEINISNRYAIKITTFNYFRAKTANVYATLHALS